MSPWDAVHSTNPKATIFSTFDCKKGYWQVSLAEESKDLTTFICSLGKFRYTRAPMGFISTGESYNQRSDKALKGLNNITKIVDDILIASETYEQHVSDIRELMDRCKANHITLNHKKMMLGRKKVKFAGYIISRDGIELDPEQIEAVNRFLTPATRQDLKSFMGLINQFRQFNQAVTKNSYMLKPLLSTKGTYVWLPEHQRAFEELKLELSRSPSLAHFDPALETRLETDASRKKGFGYVLLQKKDSGWKLVAAGSRYLRDVETRYAMVELEALAIQYGIKQCHLYLSGLPHFEVVTDHQPLKSIFNRKDLFEIDNDKLMKIKQELQSKYIFNVEYRKGSSHGVPDALSRSPVNDPNKEDDMENSFVQIAAVTSSMGIKDINITELEENAQSDEKYKKLYEAILSGFEEYKTRYGSWTKFPNCQYIRDFRPHWQNLSTEGKLIVLANRIVIPEQCKKDILKELHKGHQGITRTLQNARQSVYWQGITREVEEMCRSCNECQKLKSSLQKETLEADELPQRPFDVVSADLFYVGRNVYMIYADRLSGYPLVAMWPKDPTSKQVIRQLQQYFSLFGKPLKFRSDCGAQFDSREMKMFLEDYCIQHGQSSPYNPQSNGHAERNVGIVKQLILKTGNDIYSQPYLDGIAQIRNTPRSDGVSPCQVVFGRSIRTLIPTLAEALGTNDCIERARNKKIKLDQKQKRQYNVHAKDLMPFEPGTKVCVQNAETKEWDGYAEIVCRVRNRTYKIEFDNGKISFRNRKRMRKRFASSQSTQTKRKRDGEPPVVHESEDINPKLRRSERIKRRTNMK